MPEPSSYLQYSFLVPAALTIAGWYVVAKQTDRREFRKEVRDRVVELRQSIDDVRERANAYWLAQDIDQDVVNAIALKAALKRLSRHVHTLVSAGVHVDADHHLAEVRTAATGGDFESKSRRFDIGDHERAGDVAGVLEDLLT